jgi:hypothetical protein
MARPQSAPALRLPSNAAVIATLFTKASSSAWTINVGTRNASPLRDDTPAGTFRNRPATRSGFRAMNPDAWGAPPDIPYMSTGTVGSSGWPLATAPVWTASNKIWSLAGSFFMAPRLPRIASPEVEASVRSSCPSICNDASTAGNGAPSGFPVTNPLVSGPPNARMRPRVAVTQAGAYRAKSPNSNTSTAAVQLCVAALAVTLPVAVGAGPLRSFPSSHATERRAAERVTAHRLR